MTVAARVAKLIPALAPVVPELTVLQGSGRVMAVWACDYRDKPTAALWMQLHDTASALVGGEVPMVPSVSLLGCACQYAWEGDAAVYVVAGGVLVLSSTPLVYAPLPASADYALGALVTP